VPIPGGDLIHRYRGAYFVPETIATHQVLNASATASSPISLQVSVPFYTKHAYVLLLLSREPTSPGGLRRVVAESNATFLASTDLSPVPRHTRSWNLIVRGHSRIISFGVSGRPLAVWSTRPRDAEDPRASRDKVQMVPFNVMSLMVTYAYNAKISEEAEIISRLMAALGSTHTGFTTLIHDLTVPNGFLYGLWNTNLINLYDLTALISSEITPLANSTAYLSLARQCDAQTNCSVTLERFLPSARPDATMWLPQYTIWRNGTFVDGSNWYTVFVSAARDRCAVSPPLPSPLLPRPPATLGLVFALSAMCVAAALLIASGLRHRHRARRKPLCDVGGTHYLSYLSDPAAELSIQMDATSAPTQMEADRTHSLQITPSSSDTASEVAIARAGSNPPLGLKDSTDVQLENVTLEECIGVGGYASAWRGRWANSVVVIKVFNDRAATDVNLDTICDETAILRNLRHPHICSFFGTCSVARDECSMHRSLSASSGRVPALVLEYLAGGTLCSALGLDPIGSNTSWLTPVMVQAGVTPSADAEVEPQAVPPSTTHGQLPSRVLLRLAADVASGVHFLHSHNIIHCDLKSTNVLLDGSNPPCAKLCDFGISVLRQDVDAPPREPSIGPFSFLGTPRYQAPEMTTALQISMGVQSQQELNRALPLHAAMDVYAFGLLLFEILHGRVAFADMTPMAAMLCAAKGQRPELALRPEHEHLGQLIEACWDTDPARRFRMHQVLEALDPEISHGM